MTRKLYKKQLKTVIILIIAPLVIAFSSYKIIEAVEMHFGRLIKYGYFSNQEHAVMDVVIPGYNSVTYPTISACTNTDGSNKNKNNTGESIPLCVDSVNELISFLKLRNSGANSWIWTRTGSAFIANIIAYINSGTNNSLGKSLSDDELNIVRNALNAPGVSIDWHANMSEGSTNINTGYTGAGTNINEKDTKHDDVVWFGVPAEASEVIIISKDGKPVLKIRRACANIYDFTYDYQWTIDPIVSSLEDTVESGQIIHWNHSIKVNGASTTNTTSDVTYASSDYPYTGLTGTGSWRKTMTTGKGPNYTTASFESTFQTSDANIGVNTVCRATAATPGGNIITGTAVSAPKCVSVTPKLNPTWASSADISPGNRTAKILDTVTWSHKAKNDGPDNNDKNISYGYNTTSTIAGATVGGKYIGYIPIDTSSSAAASTFNSTYQIPSTAKNGEQICRKTYANPHSESLNTDSESSNSCVTVENTWTASADISPGNRTAKPLDTITWTHKAKNDGGDKNNVAINYGYYTTSTLSAVTIPVGQTYVNNIPTGTSGSGTYPAASTFTSTIQIPYGAKDGEKICRKTYASPKSSTDGNEKLSSDSCVTVNNPYWKLAVTSTAQVSDGGTGTWRGDNVTDPAEPLDEIRWEHTVKNDSSNPTNQTISYNYKNSNTNFDRIFAGIPLAGLSGNVWSISEPILANSSFNNTAGHPMPLYSYLYGASKFEVSQNDVGKQFCRSTVAKPFSAEEYIEITAEDCVPVPFNYELNPSVTISPENVLPIGVHPVITPNVNNEGPTKSQNTYWQLTRLVKNSPAGYIFKPGIESDDDPCTYFNDSLDACDDINHGSGVEFMPGDINPGLFNETIDFVPGSKVCYILSVKSWSSDVFQWKHSSPVCVIVAKRPKVQVLGGDIWANGSVTTSLSGSYGSWAEYGILASQRITGMASGSLFTKLGQPEINFSGLSFYNSGNDGTNPSCPVGSIGCYGGYRDVRGISIDSIIGSGDSINTWSGGDTIDLSTVSGAYTVNSDVFLSGGGVDIPAGKWVIINAPNSKVTITGDIKYTDGPIISKDNIPQVIIIAKFIDIHDIVRRVDSWLIAKAIPADTNAGTLRNGGYLNTCSYIHTDPLDLSIGNELTPAENLDANICKEQLVINGPVVADKLYLRRTAGSTILNPGEPAEIINFRADAYIWGNVRASSSTKMHTVYTTELPPRF